MAGGLFHDENGLELGNALMDTPSDNDTLRYEEDIGDFEATDLFQVDNTAGSELLLVNAPIEVDVDFTAFTATDIITYNTTIPASGAAVSGFMHVTPDITINSGVFIFSTVRDTGIYRQTVAPGFAVHTLFLGQPILTTSTATVQPNQVFIYAAQPRIQNDGAGILATGVANAIGMSFTPILDTRVSGDTLTVTSNNAVRCAPVHNTVTGTTINYGTIRGLNLVNPAVVLFGTQNGTEIMTAYVGVEMNAIPFGGNVTKRALRSALTAATNTLMIENTGGAASDFGAGGVHFNDSSPVQFGGVGFNNQDASLFWNALGYLSMFFTSNNDDLRFSCPAANRFLIDNAGGNTSGEYNFNCLKFSLGAQTGAVGNQKGVFVAGAETVTIAGEYSQFLLTQAANDTIDAALSLYAGWTINAPTPTIGTGSLTTGAALNVGGNPTGTTNRVGVRIISNPSGGSGVNAALWVTAGLTQLDGSFSHTGTTFGIFGATPAVQPPAYTPTNVTTDRAYDANATSVAELADVLGTLIADLQSLGIVA